METEKLTTGHTKHVLMKRDSYFDASKSSNLLQSLKSGLKRDISAEVSIYLINFHRIKRSLVIHIKKD